MSVSELATEDGGFVLAYSRAHGVLLETSGMNYMNYGMKNRRSMLVGAWQVVTDLANAADRSQSKLPDRQSELRVLKETLMAKTEQEEKDEKKMLDRDMDDIGEGSARGTVMSTCILVEWGLPARRVLPILVQLNILCSSLYVVQYNAWFDRKCTRR